MLSVSIVWCFKAQLVHKKRTSGVNKHDLLGTQSQNKAYVCCDPIIELHVIKTVYLVVFLALTMK